MADWDPLLHKLGQILDRAERILPQPPQAPDWAASTAYRWRRRANGGSLQPVLHLHRIRLSDLQGISEQKELIEQNTRQFVEGFPANNVLLTGAKGTGKSSLVKAVLNKFANKSLRMIEVEKQDLHDLPDIVDLVAQGVLEAFQNLDLPWPIVVRLDGTNATEGREILRKVQSDKLIPAATMREAAEKAVQLAGGEVA